MQSDRKCLATPRNAKDYLAKNDVSQLFECLMTGLMYHRPENHLDYLQDCLDKIKKHGVNSVRWDMFLAARHVPLPPISPECNEDLKFDPKGGDENLELNIPFDVAIVVVLAGPGMNKNELMGVVEKSFPRFHKIHLGRLLRDRAAVETNKGVSKWKVAASLINSGELVSDDLVLDTLFREMKYNTDVSGYIIEGYPRIQNQVENFEKHIGLNRLKFVLLIDSEEDLCQDALMQTPPTPGWSDNSSASIARRIANYKAYTLPVCKYFDDNQMLRLLDGDKTREEIQRDIKKLFKTELADYEEDFNTRQGHMDLKKRQKYPDVAPPGSCPVMEIGELFHISEEIERPMDLPQCPIVLLLGGPGSGKTGIGLEICARYHDWVFLNYFDEVRMKIFDKGIHTQNWDCLATLSTLSDVNKDSDQLVVEHWNINTDYVISQLKTLPHSTKGIVLEGFPKDEVQLDQFNSLIGKLDLVILLDCDEYYMTTRLLDRSERLHRPDDDLNNIKKRIFYYKSHTLPLCRYYDEKNRMNIIPGDKQFSEVLIDVINLIETSILKNKCIELTAEKDSNIDFLRKVHSKPNQVGEGFILPDIQTKEEPQERGLIKRGTVERIGPPPRICDNDNVKPGTVERIGLRQGSFDNGSVQLGSLDKNCSKPGSLDKTGSKPGSLDKTDSKPGSFDKLGSKPGSLDKTGSKPGSFDKLGSKIGSIESKSLGAGSNTRSGSKQVSYDGSSLVPRSVGQIVTIEDSYGSGIIGQTSLDKKGSKPSSSDESNIRPGSVDYTKIKSSSADKSSNQPGSINEISTKPSSVDGSSNQPGSINKTSTKPSSVDGSSNQPGSINKTSTKPSSTDGSSNQPGSVVKTSTKPSSTDGSSVPPGSIEKMGSKKESNDAKINTPEMIWKNSSRILSNRDSSTPEPVTKLGSKQESLEGVSVKPAVMAKFSSKHSSAEGSIGKSEVKVASKEGSTDGHPPVDSPKLGSKQESTGSTNIKLENVLKFGSKEGSTEGQPKIASKHESAEGSNIKPDELTKQESTGGGSTNLTTPAKPGSKTDDLEPEKEKENQVKSKSQEE